MSPRAPDSADEGALVPDVHASENQDLASTSPTPAPQRGESVIVAQRIADDALCIIEVLEEVWSRSDSETAGTLALVNVMVGRIGMMAEALAKAHGDNFTRLDSPISWVLGRREAAALRALGAA